LPVTKPELITTPPFGRREGLINNVFLNFPVLEAGIAGRTIGGVQDIAGYNVTDGMTASAVQSTTEWRS
jgi:hypothetical protein